MRKADKNKITNQTEKGSQEVVQCEIAQMDQEDPSAVNRRQRKEQVI